MIKLYNTLTRKIEEFKPLRQAQGKLPIEVGIYSCGPTVYWNQHIGHMYAYTQWDILVRFLRYSGFKVKWVMNITDVGHMTSDEDTGEDKMEKGAKREGVSVWDIAAKYTQQFRESLALLNIQTPDILCRATEHIQEQIDLIKKIEANGFTYKTKTGLVFDTAKFSGYADFAKLDLAKQEAGARVEVDPEKKNPWDFLLWVTNQPTHIMQWDSPWGRGFPGWHIECTAMSVKYLGERFDIHTGGIDHIPVHHTNEVAQGFGAFGHQAANFWLHNAFLTLKAEKISKSLGNMVLASDLKEKDYDPLSLRYLFFNSHYRQGMNFTWDALKSAQVALNRLRGLLNQWRQEKGREVLLPEKLKKIEDLRNRFVQTLSDDLNVPQALTVVWEVAKSNLPDPDKLDLILGFDKVLGLGLEKVSSLDSARDKQVPREVKELVVKRESLRKGEKWEEADEIRKKIEELGYQVEDMAKGPKVKKIR